MSCQYKDLFGKVGEGVHSYRIFNIAVVDVLLTVLLAFVIYIINPRYGFIYILIFLSFISRISAIFVKFQCFQLHTATHSQ